jgi:hypothetical protein
VEISQRLGATGRPDVSMGRRMISLYLQAEALRRAFPAWSIAVQPRHGDRARIEAVNPHGSGLYALISTDPAELWRELSASHAP